MLKESYLIKYSLFRSRKKFNLKNFLRNKYLENQTFEFEDFKKFLVERMVCPPQKDFFDKIKLDVLNEIAIAKEAEKKVRKKKEEEQKARNTSRVRKRKKK
jgi:hypothetical protein